MLGEDKEDALLAVHNAYARLCGIDGLGVDEVEKGEVVMDGSFHSTSVKQGQVLIIFACCVSFGQNSLFIPMLHTVFLFSFSFQANSDIIFVQQTLVHEQLK